MAHLDLDQSGPDLARLRHGMRPGVLVQRQRLMVISGVAGALAMVGVATAVLGVLL